MTQNETLIAHRKSKGLTQSQLATLAGVDKSCICHLESGKKKVSLQTLEAIASVLEIDPELLEFSFGILPKRYVPLIQKHSSQIANIFQQLSGTQRHPGKLIVFEGIDGVGKTSQIRLLSDWLKSEGFPVVTTQEPGGTRLGRCLSSLLGDMAIAPTTELLLYAADRSHHVETIIKPELAKGSIVLCDRFTDSTVAYQGYGHGLDLEMVENINQIATGGIQSDLTLWLDASVETSLIRAKKRGTLDRIEQSSFDFYNQVRFGFQEIARANPHVHRINAEDSVAKVRDEIRKVVSSLAIKLIAG